MRKKIIIIATKKITVEKFLIDIVNSFLDNDYDLKIICNDSSLLKKCFIGFDKRIVYADVSFPVSWSQLINPKFFFRVLYSLRKELNDFEGATLYTHTPVASHFSRLANILTGKTLIYHVHGFRFHDRGGVIKNLISFSLEYSLKFLTSKYIVINKDDGSVVQNKFKKDFYFIPGVGVDINKLNKVSKYSKVEKEQEGKKIIGVVGSFKLEKGYADILAVARMLNNENISFHCYGLGDSSYFESEVSRLSLNNVIIKGFDNNVVSKICNFDLLIHPSRREGLPVSVMEAMCLEVPIITTNIRGCRDLIKNHVNGSLYNPKDIDALYFLIKDFLDNPEKYWSYAMNSKSECDKKYCSKKISQKIFNIIDSL